MRILGILLLVVVVVHAQEIETVRPACAAPGDAVLVCGSGFSEEPDASFGDVSADVVRFTGQKVLVRVPDGVEPGEATLAVDGATAAFTVLDGDAPVIHHLSASAAHPGMILYVVGKRLHDGTVSFTREDETIATEPLVGGRRVAFFKVPADLETGAYTLVFVNGDGAGSGACSPALEVAEKGDPAIDAIEPEEQVPGGPVVCRGTSLGPPGFSIVHWTNGDEEHQTLGWANGFDGVYTWVPVEASGGTSYDVEIAFGDGSSTEATGPFAYTVGTPPPPEITELEYDTGPAGSWVGLTGKGLLGGFALPTITFTRGEVSADAMVFSAYRVDQADALVVEVPRDLEDGAYTVTATVAGATSNEVTFTVADLPLTVTSMTPDGQPKNGPHDLVVIAGTGFGVPDFDRAGKNGAILGDGGFSVAVTWEQAGEEPRAGLVLFHTDREILVLPPGAWHDPLEPGTYTVRVTVNPDTDDEESVEAGPYTVTESEGDSSGGSSGNQPPPGAR